MQARGEAVCAFAERPAARALARSAHARTRTWAEFNAGGAAASISVHPRDLGSDCAAGLAGRCVCVCVCVRVRFGWSVGVGRACCGHAGKKGQRPGGPSRGADQYLPGHCRRATSAERVGHGDVAPTHFKAFARIYGADGGDRSSPTLRANGPGWQQRRSAGRRANVSARGPAGCGGSAVPPPRRRATATAAEPGRERRRKRARARGGGPQQAREGAEEPHEKTMERGRTRSRWAAHRCPTAGAYGAVRA